MDITRISPAENRLKAFTRLMSVAAKLYHANPAESCHRMPEGFTGY